jgi:hypothetical protein
VSAKAAAKPRTTSDATKNDSAPSCLREQKDYEMGATERRRSALCSLTIVRTPLSLALLSLSLGWMPVHGQNSELRVFADKTGRVHVVPHRGTEQVINGEPHQINIESVQEAADGQTVGWLVDYAAPDNGSPNAGTLVVFRGGHVVRRFNTQQVFWRRSFYARGRQLAYHVGPTHGEVRSHCELHDVANGRLLTHWDGDLQDPRRPEWVKGLGH